MRKKYFPSCSTCRFFVVPDGPLQYIEDKEWKYSGECLALPRELWIDKSEPDNPKVRFCLPYYRVNPGSLCNLYRPDILLGLPRVTAFDKLEATSKDTSASP